MQSQALVGCLQGFHAVWSANNTVLVCKPDATDDLPPWVIPIAVVVCLTGILLLAAVGLLVWLKLTVQLRRKWLRDKELNNNRLKGVPNGGSAAIVVTDVEKYSGNIQCRGITIDWLPLLQTQVERNCLLQWIL